MSSKERMVLRDLAKQVADIAALPIQEEKRRLWRAHNGLRPERPMVMIDQICWNELNFDGSLTTVCTDPLLLEYETQLRQTIFKWRNMPADMVVEPFVEVPKLIDGMDRRMGARTFGLEIKEEQAFIADRSNETSSHAYVNQFAQEEDISKIITPTLSYNREKTQQNVAMVAEALDGILGVNIVGFRPNYRVWDILSTLMGVENVMYDLVDRPEFIHALVKRMLDAHLSTLDQLEEQGLLAAYQTEIHCTGAYADPFPLPGAVCEKPTAKDLWTFGLAQLFVNVSGAMYEEFDIEYGRHWYERFGLVYYGCCDPLDRKMEYIRKIPNLRKVSMSPWVDVERGAANIGPGLVFSSKPNPALLAGVTWDPELVRGELSKTIGCCRKNGVPVELILKDISTVKYRPQSLFEWEKIAMGLATS